MKLLYIFTTLIFCIQSDDNKKSQLLGFGNWPWGPSAGETAAAKARLELEEEKDAREKEEAARAAARAYSASYRASRSWSYGG